jgi:putative transposase
MPYWQLFYHIVWATKNRLPLLTPTVEPTVHEFLRSKAIGLGASVFALNGTADHVHLVAAVPPKIALSKFIGQIKGVASTKFNRPIPDVSLFWQEEYGVFSFDGKRLPNYIAYVEQQKKHHAEDKTIPILERTDDLGVSLVHEPSAIFALEEDSWRQELEKLT